MSLKILIIEDEHMAAAKIKRHLNAIDTDFTIAGMTLSVKESIAFLRQTDVDLIISDIHLSDGLSFQVFKELKIDTPVIFITAYNQYAIDAFKANSIDYLLKPVKKILLKEALDKFKRLENKNINSRIDFDLLAASLKQEKQYKERFLVETPNGDLNSVTANDIAYFFADGKYTFLVDMEGKKYFSADNISKLLPQLDPQAFFQLNRKYITHINSIDKIIKYSKSRLKIVLIPKAEDDILVSNVRVSAFKAWLGN